jgi:D-alanyl-D-alanine carboxypeptidase
MHRRPAGRATLVTLMALTLSGLGSAAVGASDEALRPVPSIPPPDLAVATLRQAAPGDAGGTANAPSGGDALDGTEVPRLPACRYRDQATRFAAVTDWQVTLLDTNLKLPRDYEPWDLVSVSRAGIKGSGMVRRRIIEDLAALAAAAREAAKPLAVRSAYRSYDTQVATFASWVRRSGYAQALRFSARPGHSEHQLGTTIDFTTAPGLPLQTSFGESPAGKWLARNGWRYGFIMSYAKGQQRVSCYGYEPWHWRYVGPEMARLIEESGQVPRRFLWENSEAAP